MKWIDIDNLGVDEGMDMYKRYENIESVKLFSGFESEQSVRVSYVIPTCNRTDTLEETINSILKQKKTFSFNIIVVDNSGDISENNLTYCLIKRISNSHIKLYVNRQNIGVCGNFNRCLQLSNGTYAAMIHDDDLLADDYSIHINSILNRIEKMNIRFGALKVTHADFSSSDHLPNLKNRKGKIHRYYLIDSLIVDGRGPTFCPTCGMIFSKDAFLLSGGFDEEYYPVSDHVLGYKMLKKGFAIFVTNDVLGYYRIGNNASKEIQMQKLFCEGDFKFREEMYQDNIYYKLWGRIFRDCQYTDSVDRRYSQITRFGIDATIDDFKFRKGYNSHSFKFLIYKIIRKAVRVITNIPF